MVFILHFCILRVFFVRKGAPSRRTLRYNIYHQMNSQVLSVAARPMSCATRVSPRGPSLAFRAIHLVSRLRRVNRLCSSKLSVNREYFTKDTQE